MHTGRIGEVLQQDLSEEEMCGRRRCAGGGDVREEAICGRRRSVGGGGAGNGGGSGGRF